MNATPVASPVIHRRRWRKQRSRSRVCNVSNAPLATVGAGWIDAGCRGPPSIQWIQSIEQCTNGVSKRKSEERPLGPPGGKKSGARARVERTRRMEFTPTNSISMWEKTRSSARSSMHAPRGKCIPENAGHRSSQRVPRCCRGKNRTALKDDPRDLKERGISLFLPFTLSR